MDTLFDLPKPAPAPSAHDYEDELKSWALLYTATETGSNSGIRFALTVPEAKKWCSWDGSQGVIHGTRWAYFWTSVWNFCHHHSGDADSYGRPTLELCTKGIIDNGEWDERIAALGLTKVPVSDFSRVFTPLGVKVTT